MQWGTQGGVMSKRSRFAVWPLTPLMLLPHDKYQTFPAYRLAFLYKPRPPSRGPQQLDLNGFWI